MANSTIAIAKVKSSSTCHRPMHALANNTSLFRDAPPPRQNQKIIQSWHSVLATFSTLRAMYAAAVKIVVLFRAASARCSLFKAKTNAWAARTSCLAIGFTECTSAAGYTTGLPCGTLCFARWTRCTIYRCWSRRVRTCSTCDAMSRAFAWRIVSSGTWGTCLWGCSARLSFSAKFTELCFSQTEPASLARRAARRISMWTRATQ